MLCLLKFRARTTRGPKRNQSKRKVSPGVARQGQLNINVDASFDPIVGTRGIGAIAGDYTGNFIAAS